jgi:MFS family permease
VYHDGVFYGWWLMLTLGVTETISWGVLNYAFVVYLQPMEMELGWSRGDLTAAFSLALLVAGGAAIPVGRWLDRHGPRALMTVGSILGTLSLVAWSQVTSLPVLYGTFVLLGLAMSATLYDPAFATASRWFDRQRLRALTVITLMAGFASTIFIPLAAWLVSQQGWRQSLLTLAVILAIGTIAPHALVLRRSPGDLGLQPDGASGASERAADGASAAQHSLSVGQALRHTSFRWLVTAYCLATLSTMAVGVHLLPYLEARGLDAGLAAALTGALGAMQVLARLVMAPFGSRTDPRLFSAAMFVLQPIALLILLSIHSWPGLLAFVVLFGAQRGLATIARPALVAELYGPQQFASIAGVLQFTVALTQAVAPFAAGLAFDALHSYEPILWTLAGVSALAVLAVLPARRGTGDRLQSEL